MSITIPSMTIQMPSISTMSWGSTAAVYTGYIRMLPPARISMMPMNSFQPHMVMVLEYAHQVDDPGDQNVEAQERDEQHVGVYLGVQRAEQQQAAEDDCQDAQDQRCSPGPLLRLCSCSRHDFSSLLELKCALQCCSKKRPSDN